MWSSNNDDRVIIRTDGIRLPDGQVTNNIKEWLHILTDTGNWQNLKGKV